jgi:WhiB family redox-sensing transcriptional regulator
MALTYSPQRWGLDDRWRDGAACAAADSDLFFPVGVTGPAVEQIAAAKAVCSTCAVQAQCLEFAIATNQEYGVWGGTSEEERRVLRRAWRARQRRAS